MLGWRRGRGRAGRRGASLVVALVTLTIADASLAKPEWVERHGVSSAHPNARFVTGYGSARGDGALLRAKQQAAADLARKLSVRIESEVSDVSAEADGQYRYKLAAVTRTTSDLELSDLDYEEPYARWGRVHVLAWLERGPAARVQLARRERALIELEHCLDAGDVEKRAGRKRAALDVYETCRRPIARALHHDAVARALSPSLSADAAYARLANASRRVDAEIESMLTSPTPSLSGAAETLALQLERQGVSPAGRLVVGPLRYGPTDLSSPFGRQAGLEIERALARRRAPSADAFAEAAGDPWGDRTRAREIVVTGAYLESGERVRLSVTAREIDSGRLVASAEATMPRAAVPGQLALEPAHFEATLANQKLLRAGAGDDAGLRVRVSTGRGSGSVVYSEGERIRLYVSVNRPAWVRLVYVLHDGVQVPIDQAFRVDARHAGSPVAYPVDFDVVAPFGIEMVHATAFTEKPPPLDVRERVIAGQRYEVVADGLRSVMRTRGIAARGSLTIAEDTLTVTTLPSL